MKSNPYSVTLLVLSGLAAAVAVVLLVAAGTVAQTSYLSGDDGAGQLAAAIVFAQVAGATFIAWLVVSALRWTATPIDPNAAPLTAASIREAFQKGLDERGQ